MEHFLFKRKPLLEGRGEAGDSIMDTMMEKIQQLLIYTSLKFGI